LPSEPPGRQPGRDAGRDSGRDSGFGPGGDAGLLEPVWAGTTAAAACCDHAWLRALLDAEAGLVRAQARLGSVPADAASAITDAARTLDVDLAGLAVRARGGANPVIPLVAELRLAIDRAVRDRDGARDADWDGARDADRDGARDADRDGARDGEQRLAQYVHRGATSQDIMDTAAMLVAARTREVILSDLDRVLAALAELAVRHRDTPMAGRTLGQQAVPTTFGLKAAGWLVACARARARLAGLRLPVQLGGAAGTMGAPGLAVELLAHYAEELDLAEPVLPWHTLRAPVLDLGTALAAVTGALGKIATDVVLLAQTEVGEVAEPAAPGRGGSSVMPHKRNPALATMIRSAALQVPAQVQILLTAQSAPLERPAGEWHAEWQPLRECLRLTGGAAETAAELTAGLEVFPDRMRANLDDLLAVLAEHGESTDVGSAAGALVDRALAYYRKVSG
jgi:nitrosuccinate lyase